MNWACLIHKGKDYGRTCLQFSNVEKIGQLIMSANGQKKWDKGSTANLSYILVKIASVKR